MKGTLPSASTLTPPPPKKIRSARSSSLAQS